MDIEQRMTELGVISKGSRAVTKQLISEAIDQYKNEVELELSGYEDSLPLKSAYEILESKKQELRL